MDAGTIGAIYVGGNAFKRASIPSGSSFSGVSESRRLIAFALLDREQASTEVERGGAPPFHVLSTSFALVRSLPYGRGRNDFGRYG